MAVRPSDYLGSEVRTELQRVELLDVLPPEPPPSLPTETLFSACCGRIAKRKADHSFQMRESAGNGV